jgi:hypothetical protein
MSFVAIGNRCRQDFFTGRIKRQGSRRRGMANSSAFGLAAIKQDGCRLVARPLDS